MAEDTTTARFDAREEVRGEWLVRTQVLDKAVQAVSVEKEVDYGPPRINFEGIAEFWNAYISQTLSIDINLQPVDIANMMVLLKIARSLSGQKLVLDNYVDMCGYAALAAELAPEEQ